MPSSRLVVVPALATLIAWAPRAEPASVEVVDALVSADFEATPVPEALDAVRDATGVAIVVPASVTGKTVTLSVRRLPFERFVRRLLERLDLGGFAIVFESEGAVSRVLVVEQGAPATTAPPVASPGGPKPAAGTPAQAPPPGEPAYIPPREIPVYTPPSTPPRYTPPASPPVYVPSPAPPVYVPSPAPPVVPPAAGAPRPGP